MPLKRVRIERFRCLEREELALHAQRNYLFGPNGAGKTSVLEAIHLLGRGRSFRTRETRRLIQRGHAGFSVYGEVEGDQGTQRIGIGWTDTGVDMRLNGAPARGMAQLADVLPVHVIDPSLHQLIEGGPSERRRFLDWGVFHVEHGYLATWRRYRRVLGQRNAALKAAARGQALGAWNLTLAEAGQGVDAARARYVERLQRVLAPLGERLLGEPLELCYGPGWSGELSLHEALGAAEARDRALGTTQVGPHRAELRVALGTRGVREQVSRGQQKLVAAALILGQVAVFGAQRRDAGMLLIDDPGAELDPVALAKLLDALEGIRAQLILTGLSAEQLAPPSHFPVFHVERGRVTSVL